MITPRSGINFAQNLLSQKVTDWFRKKMKNGKKEKEESRCWYKARLERMMTTIGLLKF